MTAMCAAFLHCNSNCYALAIHFSHRSSSREVAVRLQPTIHQSKLPRYVSAFAVLSGPPSPFGAAQCYGCLSTERETSSARSWPGCCKWLSTSQMGRFVGAVKPLTSCPSCTSCKQEQSLLRQEHRAKLPSLEPWNFTFK